MGQPYQVVHRHYDQFHQPDYVVVHANADLQCAR
jgi:hypothetical protein